jgi:GNAT superfamily N-acetyltransferase
LPSSKDSYKIRPIEPSDRLTGLSLGDEAFVPLKTFLQRHAKTYHEQHLARTYGAFIDTKIIAYITLVCGEIVLEGDATLLDEADIHYDYKSYPALKIARLAVHQHHRDIDLGTILVQLAIGIAKEKICPAAGCRFVAVDSKQQSVGFYEKQGFAILDTTENRDRREPVMFLDLLKAGQLS